ncbi:replication endonuclease [Pasteurella atlantica]|uniref:replication endonuclease n=1 Tax=Phocoenobacter atlanticus TaxID=3416742 RepID=UPI001BCA314D|nr:replication endonuclease [Pasteurella atlantica]MDP8160688.1 replication endonuclease [Pasteurella atlantica]QVE20159.1 replication endonuclease [Pasteurella atlantica]
MAGWDSQAQQQRAEEVYQRNLQNIAEKLPLNNNVKPQFDDKQVTNNQLELFDLVGKDSFDYVEALLRKLPTKRQREYFRGLYLRAYKSVKDDGSIGFAIGNKQRAYANCYLRDLFDKHLNLVLDQYQVDFSWLDRSVSEQRAYDIYREIEEGKKAEAMAKEVGKDYQKFSRPNKIKGILNHCLGRKRKKNMLDKKAEIPFFLLNEQRLKDISKKLADIFLNLQTDFFTHLANSGKAFSEEDIDQVMEDCFVECGEMCKKVCIEMPYWKTFEKTDNPKVNQMQIALSKITSETFWFKQLRTLQKRMVEHIAIACGEVQKKVSPYISKDGLRDWKMQMRKNYDFLKEMIVENIEEPEEQVALLDMFLRSNSNPQLRRIEMMTRLRGVEEWAEENGLVALFLTLTAPSKYHAQLSTGGRNPKWNGASPRATHLYLNTVWQQYRALLNKYGIKGSGMRVAEPHHDATPHWHLLFFVPVQHKEKAIELFKMKALEEDGDEAGAKKHRCKVEECDKKKGTPTGYIAKYIAKNIDGFADDDVMSDEVKDIDLKENSKRARAWASLWGIRQFQFYGAGNISVWRELRRCLTGKISDKKLEELRLFADMGEYACYLQGQGGALVKRTDQYANLCYEECDANQYGEVSKKITGIRSAFESVKTRLKKWVIKKAVKQDERSQDERSPKIGERSEAKNTELCSAWTCVNNCNPIHSKGLGYISVSDYLHQRPKEVEKLKMALRWRGIPENWINNNHIYSLLKGGSVKLNNYQSIEYDGNEIRFC